MDFLNFESLFIAIPRKSAAFLASKLCRFSISVNLASNQMANSRFKDTSRNTFKIKEKNYSFFTMIEFIYIVFENHQKVSIAILTQKILKNNLNFWREKLENSLVMF